MYIQYAEINSSSETKIYPRTGDKQTIYLKNDVWIGYEAVIMSGVTIGDGAIIGTRAVVTRDVPPYTIVGGMPAKLIRKRFSDEIISFLLEIKWWEWSDEKIKENISAITTGYIDKLKMIKSE